MVKLQDASVEQRQQQVNDAFDGMTAACDVVDRVRAEVETPRFGGRIREVARQQIEQFISDDEIYKGIRSRFDTNPDAPVSPEAFDKLTGDLLTRFEKISRSSGVTTGVSANVQRLLALSLYVHVSLGASEDPVINTLLRESGHESIDFGRSEVEDALGVNPLGRPRIDLKAEHSPEDALQLTDYYLKGSGDMDAHWIHSFREALKGMGSEQEAEWLGVMEDVQLEHLNTTHQVVEQLKKFEAREELSRTDLISLPLKIDRLKEFTGLTHLSNSRQHLIDLGYTTEKGMERLERESILAARGVKIPSSIRSARNGDRIVQTVVENCTLSSDHPDFGTEIQQKLNYEKSVLKKPQVRARIEELLGKDKFSELNTAEIRSRVVTLVNAMQRTDDKMSDAGAVDIAVVLEHNGIQGDEAAALLKSHGSNASEMKEAAVFLEQLAILGAGGTRGTDRLFDNAAKATKLRFGYYAEADMAMSLKSSGFTVHELSKSDNLSGHSEYDIVATTPDGSVTFGIEVKTTFDAFFEKNWGAYQGERGGGVERTQVYRLAKNAEIDGYTPAILARRQERESTYSAAADLLGKVTAAGHPRPEFLTSKGKVIKWWE